MRKYGVPVVVAINKFYADTDAEIDFVKKYCKDFGAVACVSEGFAKGGEGAAELAQLVCDTIGANESTNNFGHIYDAEKSIKEIERLGRDKLPVCVAKTQYSLSDDPTKLGRPENFKITVRDVRLYSGAGFITVMTGDILTMPGLPKAPSALKIDIHEDGTIEGLF